MAGFWNGLRSIGRYERSRLAGSGGLVGMAAQHLPGGVRNAQPPPMQGYGDSSMSPTDMHAPPVMDNPPQPGAMSQDDSITVPTPMGEGRLITKPTTAVLGENGVEAVIPLNNAVGNKTSLSMLSPMSRYKRP